MRSGSRRRRLSVYPAEAFRVVDGANLGDPIGEANELVPGDVYALSRGARQFELTVAVGRSMTLLRVAESSPAGRAGARVVIDCCATFMALDGTTVEALILAELDAGEQHTAQLWLMPFSPPAEKTDYALVAIDRRSGAERLAELGCLSFARGTRITLANGEQRPVEELRPGDMVLTRNHGAQPLHWICARVRRASGAFAPIVIAKGVLNNERELILSPGQRVFVYQRRDLLGTGRREVFVPASMLVNGRDVVRGEGGFVEYFDLMFDAPEIVYAEGIATQSFAPAPEEAEPILPPAVLERLRREGARLRGSAPAVTLSEGALEPEHATEILRLAGRA